MSKMQEEFMKQQQTGSIGGDEDYLYEQYLMQEKMNEEYWEYVAKKEANPDYIPTPEEEQQNFVAVRKQGEGDKGSISIDDFCKQITEEVNIF